MGALIYIWELVAPYIGIINVIIITIVLFFIGKILFEKKHLAYYYYQIISVVIFLIGLLLAIVVSPMDDNIKKQILSLIGVLLSSVIALSSTNFIGNAMAGIMLRIAKNYKPGDFIEVDESRGRIYNMGLLSTEIQIITSDTITFPNMYLVKQPIRVIHSNGSFISVAVSLGYDVSRVKIEEFLLEAANKCKLEKNFVYIEDLLDHAVVYRVFGFAPETQKLISLKSDLRKNILDSMHKNGIEIVSPGFVNRRVFDENKQFIPKMQSDKNMKKERNIEKNIFNKADEAENIEKLKEKLAEFKQNKVALNDKIKESSDEESLKYENELKILDRKIKALNDLIDKRTEAKNKR